MLPKYLLRADNQTGKQIKFIIGIGDFQKNQKLVFCNTSIRLEVNIRFDRFIFGRINSKSNMSDAEIIEAVQETVKDPFCDEKNPKIITFHDVTSASFKIKGGIEYTPCPVSNFS